MKLKAIGSSVWVQQDSDPYWVTEPPDIVVNKIEDAIKAKARFVVLTGAHFRADEEPTSEDELMERTFYITPESIVAISQRLVELDDD